MMMNLYFTCQPQSMFLLQQATMGLSLPLMTVISPWWQVVIILATRLFPIVPDRKCFFFIQRSQPTVQNIPNSRENENQDNFENSLSLVEKNYSRGDIPPVSTIRMNLMRTLRSMKIEHSIFGFVIFENKIIKTLSFLKILPLNILKLFNCQNQTSV